MHMACIYFERLSFYLYMQPKLFQNALLICLLRGKEIPIYRTLEIW